MLSWHDCWGLETSLMAQFEEVVMGTAENLS